MTPGLPARFRSKVHSRAIRSGCQRRIVWGVTIVAISERNSQPSCAPARRAAAAGRQSCGDAFSQVAAEGRDPVLEGTRRLAAAARSANREAQRRETQRVSNPFSSPRHAIAGVPAGQGTRTRFRFCTQRPWSVLTIGFQPQNHRRRADAPGVREGVELEPGPLVRLDR